MKTLFNPSTIFAALILSILAAAGADESALLSVVEAEKSFAATSVERGIRESFLKFFAENSIIFAPEPKNGKKFYTYYEDKGRRLNWRPIFATISSSGELGVTTGPWEMAKSKTEPAPIAFGDFLSVWRKQLDGSWKVIVDVGVDHADPGEPPQQPQLLPPSGAAGARTDVDLARRTLQAADSKLTDSLKQSGDAAILDVASDHVRVLRQNVLPAVGRDATTSLLRADRVGIARSFIDGGLSDAGDLAYRYGSYSSAEKNASERGYYLTIWRAEANGDWKIIVDLQKKTPAM
jgi:ketosteroid isomerase-like protein